MRSLRQAGLHCACLASPRDAGGPTVFLTSQHALIKIVCSSRCKAEVRADFGDDSSVDSEELAKTKTVDKATASESTGLLESLVLIDLRVVQHRVCQGSEQSQLMLTESRTAKVDTRSGPGTIQSNRGLRSVWDGEPLRHLLPHYLRLRVATRYVCIARISANIVIES
jgi:hypothetical protein